MKPRIFFCIRGEVLDEVPSLVGDNRACRIGLAAEMLNVTLT